MCRSTSRFSRSAGGDINKPDLVQLRPDVLPGFLLEQQVVAFRDHQGNFRGDGDGRRHRFIEGAAELRRVDHCLIPPHQPAQQRQVPAGVERVDGTLALPQRRALNDGVAQVEAVHGYHHSLPGPELLLQPGSERGLAGARRTRDAQQHPPPAARSAAHGAAQSGDGCGDLREVHGKSLDCAPRHKPLSLPTFRGADGAADGVSPGHAVVLP
ncbi:hypothetical protein GCM10018951_13810 [Pseudarthrobacter polychromogenes]